MADDMQARIDEIVRTHKIVIFMKGTPSLPQCGFSNRAAKVLASTGKPFHAIDVIAEPEYREAVKAYSNWPTLPQIFIGGELVGGSDILMQMYENGQLDATIEREFGQA